MTNLTRGELGLPQGVTISEGTKGILVGCFRERVQERLEPRKLLEMVNGELRRRPQKLQLVQQQHGLRSSHDTIPPYIEPQKNVKQSVVPVSQNPNQQNYPVVPSVFLNGPSAKFGSPPRSLELS